MPLPVWTDSPVHAPVHAVSSGCPAAALADRAADEHRSAWSQGDPAAAAAKRAAAAASAEDLLETLGSTALRTARVDALRRTL